MDNEKIINTPDSKNDHNINTKLSPHTPHDKGYKKDLKKPSEFLHFLQKYVGADWTKDLEASQLSLCDKEFISRDYEGKEADILYSIQQKDDSKIYVFVLQELQSTVDHTMIFRVLVYIVNVLTDYFMRTDKNTRKRADFKLPAIVPVVFYNGSEKWTAAQELKSYLNSADLFGEYTLNLKYHLIDLNKIDEEYILNSNTIIDNIMYCDKLRKNTKLILAVRNSYQRVSQLGKEESEEFLNWSENILLSICGNNKNNVKQLLDAIRNGDDNMAFEYTIERVFREERERIAKEAQATGLAEGRIADRTDSIIELLSEHGTIPDELHNKITSEHDMNILKQWLKLSAKVSSIEEFSNKMNNLSITQKT